MSIHRTRTLPDMSFAHVVGSYVRLLRPCTMFLPIATLGSAATISSTLTSGKAGFVVAGDGLLKLAIGLLIAICLQGASNALNQICDYEIDVYAKPLRPLPKGEMGLTGAALTSALLYVLGCVALLFLPTFRTDTILLLLAIATLQIAYSSAPFRLKRYGWIASVAYAIPFGLYFLAGWSLYSTIDEWLPWMIVAPVIVALVSASIFKDIPDMEADEHFGVWSLPSKFGPDRATQVAALLLVAPFVFLPVIIPMAFELGGLRLEPTLVYLLAGTLTFWAMAVVASTWKNATDFEPTRTHRSLWHVHGMLTLYVVGLALCVYIESLPTP